MSKSFLDFEKPAVIIGEKISELMQAGDCADINLTEEIEKLQKKEKKLIESIFNNLNDNQIVQMARHPERPYGLDIINLVFSDFNELHGDRNVGDCSAIIAGLAKLDGLPVAVIAHEKGRTVEERIKRNFGMPQPEGYRKALRIMKLANKFKLPIITLIDTQGAYPGVNAEKNNQSEAIARNLFEMPNFSVPIISIVIGEGSSGGALAIGVADIVAMLQYSIYTTISPEGCASILFKDASRSVEASKAMCLTADKLREKNLIDAIIEEPLGGAHRSFTQTANNIKQFLLTKLPQLLALDEATLRQKRYDKLMMHHLYEE
jgi:acetyl-CoA carboxylase carboxyl transferase subunit alpha